MANRDLSQEELDDSKQKNPVDGIYLLQEADKMIARRITMGDEVVISNGKTKQRVARDTFGLLRIAGRVICLFAPVTK